MTILTAIVSPVKLGTIEIDGLMFPDGSYGVAVPQICDLFADTHTFKTSRNTAARDLKRLMGKDSKTSSCRTEFNRATTTYVDLLDFEKVLRKLDKNSNPIAETMSEALVGLSLHQLFCDSFGIKFEAQDRQNWLKARMAGKVTRRTLTDAVKEWYQRNPGGTSCPMGVMIGRVTDAIYLALWESTAKQIESKLGCDRHESRNHLSEAQLAILDRAEDRVTEFIDLDNIKPIDAVAAAGIRPARVPI